MIYSNVLLIGLGGTGSYLFNPLFRYLSNKSAFEKFYLIDGDKLEDKNLVRQNLIGRNGMWKLDALFYEDRHNVLTKKYEYIQNVQPYLANHGVNLIVSCVDNNKGGRTPQLNSLMESETNWVFISPGNATYNGQTMAYAIIDNQTYGVNPMDIYPELENPTDHAPGERIGCDRIVQEIPQTLAANLNAATHAFNIVFNLTEFDTLIQHSEFDLMSNCMRYAPKIFTDGVKKDMILCE